MPGKRISARPAFSPNSPVICRSVRMPYVNNRANNLCRDIKRGIAPSEFAAHRKRCKPLGDG
jgi:hypothetical protein